MPSDNHIGNVYFDYPLVIVGDVPPVSGRVTRCLGGELVVVTMPVTSREYQVMTLDVAFEWAPAVAIQRLQALWGLGSCVTFKADYVYGSAIIDPTSGIHDLQHIFGDGIPFSSMEDTESDYFNGKVKLQVIQGYRW